MEQVIGKLNVHPKEQLTSEVDISVVEVNRVIEVEVEIFLKTRVILKEQSLALRFFSSDSSTHFNTSRRYSRKT
jgi:hypothetical protein